MKWFLLLSLFLSMQVHAQTADEIRRIMNPKSTYYDILGVNPNATEDEIKKAYRRLLKAYHADRYDTDPVKKKAANTVLARINPARDVLSDAVARKKYDLSIKVSGSAGTGAGRTSGFTASEAKKWTPQDFGTTEKPKNTSSTKSSETPKQDSSYQRSADKASSTNSSSSDSRASSSNDSAASDFSERASSRTSEASANASSSKASPSTADTAANAKNISPEARAAVKFYQDTARCGGEGFFKRFVDVML